MLLESEKSDDKKTDVGKHASNENQNTNLTAVGSKKPQKSIDEGNNNMQTVVIDSKKKRYR